MSDNIIPYVEMCRREGISLQRGMNFGVGQKHSVILMSLRKNAPYRDALEEDGTVLIYEGHDIPRLPSSSDPKLIDQPERTPKGSLTENGKFHKAAQEYKRVLARRKEFESTRRFTPASGLTTGFFT